MWFLMVSIITESDQYLDNNEEIKDNENSTQKSWKTGKF